MTLGVRRKPFACIQQSVSGSLGSQKTKKNLRTQLKLDIDFGGQLAELRAVLDTPLKRRLAVSIAQCRKHSVQLVKERKVTESGDAGLIGESARGIAMTDTKQKVNNESIQNDLHISIAQFARTLVARGEFGAPKNRLCRC